MSGRPGNGRLGSIRWWRSPDDAEVFLYADDRVRPEQDPQGRPALTLFQSGTDGVLQAGARWGPDESELDALRNRLRESFPEVDAAFLRLTPAPARVNGARLETGGSAPKVLATSSTSGYPPYAAVFSASLMGDDLAAVMSALGGSKGRLFVRYDAALEEPSRCEAVLTGVVDGAAGVKNAAAAETLVKKALSSKAVVLAVSGDGCQDAELRAEVEGAAIRQAAQALLTDAAEDPKLPRQLEVRADKTVTRETELQPEADVAAWFEGRSATDHIITTPGGTVHPE